MAKDLTISDNLPDLNEQVYEQEAEILVSVAARLHKVLSPLAPNVNSNEVSENDEGDSVRTSEHRRTG